MTDKAYAVPLHEQLASVPRDARLIIDDPDGKGTRFIPVGRYCHEAAEALRARLAQPEPSASVEPVAWRIRCTDPMRDWVLMYRHPKAEEQFSNMEIQPLYTAPPQREWQGLTDEDIEDVCWTEVDQRLRSFARAIEAKLKEKNA